MIYTGINLGKVAAAGVGALKKLVMMKSGQKALKEALQKPTELLSAGIAVKKIESSGVEKEETTAAEDEKTEAVEDEAVITVEGEDVIVSEVESTTIPETEATSEVPSEAEADGTIATASEVEVAATQEAEAAMAGLTPIALTRRLPDGDNDDGRGWQCSKYAWYLATGVRMNYAPHPDYGPCNGGDVVDYLITHLGWKECGKKDGAIFSFRDEEFGHAGMVIDAVNNIVNDANTKARPLQVDTHVEKLDEMGARYVEE